MKRLLFAALCWTATAAAQEVVIPADDGLALRATLALPSAPTNRVAIVALHGCGGPSPQRDGQWRDILTAQGHAVLFPDSFGSRGLGPQCRVRERTVRPGRERLADTQAAVGWLAGQPFGQAGVAVIGWSNGGSTALAVAGRPGRTQIRGVVAFYPGCQTSLDRADWRPAAPLLILIGAADDWTPAEPCRRLAARFPERIQLIEYPGAFHDFDAPDRPLRRVTGLAYTAGGNGVAHAGTDPAARADAPGQVARFLASLP